MNINTVNRRFGVIQSIIFLSSLVIALTLISSATYGLPAGQEKLNNAKSWLISQQESDGGFELSDFPGFETPDAILVIALSSQTSTSYSSSLAFDAVSAVKTNNKTPLDYVDDLVDSKIDVATACKLIVNVVAPLGLDARDFDPSDDSINQIDLLGPIHTARLADGSFGAGVFNTTLTCAMAEFFVDGSISDATLSYIENSQAADGSFNYAGEPTLLDGGSDTSALALEVLVAGGRERTSKSIEAVLGYLATTINADGSFSSFGTPDPNSTALAIRGLKSAGVSLALKEWRDFYAPDRLGTAYISPESWLMDQQSPDGHFVSPYESFGLNTFATSQSISALSGSWFPVRALDQFVLPVIFDETTQTTPTTSDDNATVQVAGQSIAGSDPACGKCSQVSGTLVNTGSDSADMAIIASIVIVLGGGMALGSKKLKKTRG